MAKKSAVAWGKLESEYLKAKSVSGITLSEWCEMRDINYSTAKNHIRSIVKDNVETETLRDFNKRLKTDSENIGKKHLLNEKIEFYCEQYGKKKKYVDFLRSYFVSYNIKQAASEAGINSNTAYAFMAQDSTRNMLSDIADTNVQATLLTSDRLVGRMAIIANANLKDYFNINGGVMRPQEWTREQALAIKKYTVTPSQFGEKVEIELYDAVAAMVHLGKPDRLFDKPEETDFSDWTDEEISAEIEKLKGK